MLEPHAGFNSSIVTRRIDWAAHLFSLRVQVANTPYIAGQFTKLALYDDQGELIRRAYSIVNHPRDHQQTGELEFLIITDPNGQLSPRLQKLKIGDELLVGTEGAGFMTLNEIPQQANDLWLLSTGTAIGPFLSILDDETIKTRFQRIILVNATRYDFEQSYQEQIIQLKSRYQERFTYVPVVSRESVSGALSGRIPMLLDTHALQTAAGLSLDTEKSFIYLCGNPEMVKDTTESLKKMGFRRHLRRKHGQFSSENYW
ncbi:MAG TPA: ferredoxin--NADP(+) reductase [Vibrio sp.]|nr:ferredoxin--NADP(+) reductase [Vibrio sp.]